MAVFFRVLVGLLMRHQEADIVNLRPSSLGTGEATNPLRRETRMIYEPVDEHGWAARWDVNADEPNESVQVGN